MEQHVELQGTEIVTTYSGTNNYINYLKLLIKKRVLKILTKDQATYVVKYKNTTPVDVNKKVELHYCVRDFFQRRFRLDKIPKYVFINKLLSRDGEELHIWGNFDENSKDYRFININKKDLLAEPKKVELTLDKIKRQPLEHQIPAITKLLQNDRFILADDMGLGKTSSAINAAIIGDYKKILIICPASLKVNWKKEILQASLEATENNISIITSSNMSITKWNIINYDIVRNYHSIQRKTKDYVKTPLEFHDFDLVILDEAHYIKNATSDRSKLVLNLIENTKTVWFLTGTPITNKPIDLFNLLKACKSPLGDNWERYVYRYCDGKSFKKKGSTKKIWITNGASNLLELKNFTQNILFKRNKSEVLSLPKKIITQKYFELTEMSLYKNYVNEYVDWYNEECEKGKKPSSLSSINQLTKLRKLIALDKVKNTISEMESLIEDGHNVVVFSCFSEPLKDIYEHFGNKAVLIDGSVNPVKRQAIVEDFQTNPKIKVFCGNIVAAGVGLTLTKGDVVIFNDIDWTPANHSQAEDRIYRIGQDKECTIIYTLLADTIDDEIYEKLIMKFNNINTFMGDEFLNYTNADLINSIIEKMITKIK